MSWSPEIIGIGPYKKDIAHLLGYPEEYFNETPEGTILCQTLMSWVTKDMAMDFLDTYCGWTESDVTFFKKSELPDIDTSLTTEYAENMEIAKNLRTLQKAGWRLFFLPNY